MNTQYDVNYFINKFSAIPDEQWLECKLHSDEREWDAHCAVGHCLNWGFLETQESLALYRTIGKRDIVAQINNGFHSCYPQPTPKARILAALADAKARAEAALDAYETRELKPLSPVLQEQVIATDGPVSCEYLAGSSVAGRQA